MNGIKRYLLIGITVVIWFLIGIIPLFANDDEQRVFDYADLLTDAEESELTKAAQSIESEIETEVYVLTTNDAEGKSSMAYADDFGDQHAFGYEEAYGTYVIFLIDMDNRTAWISTSGKAINQLNDKRIDSILDEIFRYLPEEQYYESCYAFLQQMEQYMKVNLNPDSSEYNTDSYPDTILEYDDDSITYTNEQQAKLISNLGISAIISLVIAVIVLLILLSNAKTRMTVNGSTYEMQGAFQMKRHIDDYLRTTTVKHKIEKNHGGSSGGRSHISSGGHRHGGGGRKF